MHPVVKAINVKYCDRQCGYLIYLLYIRKLESSVLNLNNCVYVFQYALLSFAPFSSVYCESSKSAPFTFIAPLLLFAAVVVATTIEFLLSIIW